MKTELASCKQRLVNATNEINRLKEKMCQDVVCKNRGTCEEGECICMDGFGGSTCEKKGRLWYKNSDEKGRQSKNPRGFVITVLKV